MNGIQFDSPFSCFYRRYRHREIIHIYTEGSPGTSALCSFISAAVMSALLEKLPFLSICYPRARDAGVKHASELTELEGNGWYIWSRGGLHGSYSKCTISRNG